MKTKPWETKEDILASMTRIFMVGFILGELTGMGLAIWLTLQHFCK